MRLRDTGGYEKKAPKQRRELLDNAILSLVPDLKFRSSILPSFARAFVQKKGNLERVHILAYCPKGHGHACAIEDRISLVDTEISLRTDGRKVRNVYLAPGWKELPFAWKDGYSKFSSFHDSEVPAMQQQVFHKVQKNRILSPVKNSFATYPQILC